MHLIIQIPCFNEAETLPRVLADLPQSLPGVDCLEVLVIDDGSTDGTAAIATQLGVQHVVRHTANRGVAAAFQTGLNSCLRAGADIIVNTDGDHQYPGNHIATLIDPIIRGRADMVIGDRQTQQIVYFSPLKRLLQRTGSWVVRLASGTDVPDATSGFRAFSREAALRLVVLTRFSYTLETIIQASKKGLHITPLRQSRLVKNNWDFVRRQAVTILRIYALYEPLRTFALSALPFLLSGIFLIGRFLFFYVTGLTGWGRHIQSLVIGGTLFTVGFLILLIGIMADITASNRSLLEEILYQQRKRELGSE
jgi:glycosyltransferase involved in cell wall biosynthesis